MGPGVREALLLRALPATRRLFRTRFINRGVEAASQVNYRASKVRQYFKEGRALPYRDDRQRHLRLRHRPARHRRHLAGARPIGHDVNERLLDAQLQACACAPAGATRERVVLASRDPHDLAAPALRFGDSRMQALLAALCAFQYLLEGVSNRSLLTLVAGLLPGYSARQLTYDLRRLRRNGFSSASPAPGAPSSANQARIADAALPARKITQP